MEIYRSIFRPLLFRADPEFVHNFSIAAGGMMGKVDPFLNVLHTRNEITDARLQTEVAGLKFKNPVGLAAGYDKSGRAVRFLEALGFSHVEIGSVSADPSAGNPKPRLFRLPEDKALVVHYGLQNDGAGVIAARLKKMERRNLLGVNIVKTNRGIDAPAEQEDAILEDYRQSAILLKDKADYITFNMSCPNTETGRDFFGDKSRIIRFLELMDEVDFNCPVFLKISPLGGVENIERYLEAADGFPFVKGFIFNLPPGKSVPLKTPERVWKNWPGAISGKPVESLINSCIGEMYKRMDRSKYSIIGAGGIFTAEDALYKIKLGASLVQILTALVYNGPSTVRKINEGLLELLEREGYKNLAEAVGSG